MVYTISRFILYEHTPSLSGVLPLGVMTYGCLGLLAGFYALLWVGARELASGSLRDRALASHGLLTSPRFACGGHTVLQLLVLPAGHLARVDDLLTHLGTLIEYRRVDNNVIFSQDLLGLPLCGHVTRRKECVLVWDIFGPPWPALPKKALFEAT
jgi:hypothetical protein